MVSACVKSVFTLVATVVTFEHKLTISVTRALGDSILIITMVVVVITTTPPSC